MCREPHTAKLLSCTHTRREGGTPQHRHKTKRKICTRHTHRCAPSPRLACAPLPSSADSGLASRSCDGEVARCLALRSIVRWVEQVREGAALARAHARQLLAGADEAEARGPLVEQLCTDTGPEGVGQQMRHEQTSLPGFERGSACTSARVTGRSRPAALSARCASLGSGSGASNCKADAASSCADAGPGRVGSRLEAPAARSSWVRALRGLDLRRRRGQRRVALGATMLARAEGALVEPAVVQVLVGNERVDLADPIRGVKVDEAARQRQQRARCAPTRAGHTAREQSSGWRRVGLEALRAVRSRAGPDGRALCSWRTVRVGARRHELPLHRGRVAEAEGLRGLGNAWRWWGRGEILTPSGGGSALERAEVGPERRCRQM